MGVVARPIELVALRPRWLAVRGRGRMGLSMDCPRHPGTAGDSVEVWFQNPLDGGPPREGVVLVAAFCDEPPDFELLTILPTDGQPYRALLLGHWWGWLVEGRLTESPIQDASW